MNADFVKKKFETIGSRIGVRFGHPFDFAINIARDRRGEFFDLLIADDASDRIDFSVLEVRPKDRHLLLLANSTTEDGSPNPRKFLCGHDERHWFVAEVPRGSTVREAKEALKPPGAIQAQERHGVKPKHRNRRRNAGFIRQGEWFFVPADDLVPDEWLVLSREPLRRGGGKPHVVDLLYCRNGTEIKSFRWQVMRRNAAVYVKGRVRHPDHKTIVLRSWHRVFLSMENLTSNVAFLD